MGRTVKKVVSGVKKLAKKVWNNPIGKALIVAGTLYFGGAAIGGMMSGAGGAGAGALGNAAAGISNAWSGLTKAASAAMGGNFSQAGQMLSAGAKGATTGGMDGLLVNAGTRAANTGVISGSGVANAGNAAGQTLTAGGKVFSAGSNVVRAAPSSSTSIINGKSLGDMTLSEVAKAAPNMTGAQYQEAVKVFGETFMKDAASKSGGGLLSNPLVQYGAMQLGGQALAGYSAQKAQEEDEEDARKRYNANVGAPNLYTSKY